jgi:Tol biopolymer transport system component
MRSRIPAVLASTGLWVFLLVASAQAAFPGANGKIAFHTDRPLGISEIFVMNPDGSAATDLTNTLRESEEAPAWSPDGGKIVFEIGSGPLGLMNADGSGQTFLTPGQTDDDPDWSPDGTKVVFDSFRTGQFMDIYVINADGTGTTRVTTSTYRDIDPVWSPDGKKIAFSSASIGSPGEYDLYTIRPDGTGLNKLADRPEDVVDVNADWSPDGSRIVYTSVRGPNSYVYVMNADGTGRTSLTNTGVDSDPSWSPDGSKVAFTSRRDGKSGIYSMNADGTQQVRLTDLEGTDDQPDWQPIPLTYIRPKAAAPMRVSLVPAYDQCVPASANRTHGPPLGFPSCSPPSQSSGQLTIGTADANGQPTKSISLVRYGVHVGNPQTPADEADVRIVAQITDVRKRSDLSDYTGELQLDQGLRITDRDNTPNPGGPGPGTETDTSFPVTIPCAGTADASVGSTCSIDTTVEAIAPNAVKEGRRAVWGLGQVKVYDGGLDGTAATTGDNTLFMDEGLFIP